MTRTIIQSLVLLLGLATTIPAYSQEVTNYIGTWEVDLGATASTNDTYRRVDNTTIERTTTTTVGKGAKGMGTLQIKADGTYRLAYWEYEVIYRKPLITGTWKKVPAGEAFGDVQAIVLEGAKPDPKYEAKDRRWYVFRKEDGTYEARYPPYDGYAKIKLTRQGTASGAKQIVSAKKPTTAATPQPKKVNTVKPSAPSSSPAKPAGVKTYTTDEVRKALEGKTRIEVEALLGKPVKEGYGTFSYNGVERVFPPCPNGCNWESFAIQYGKEGGKLSSLELQYWVVQ